MPSLKERKDEERQIEEIVQKQELPRGVLDYRIELGEDSTGDPAAFIWFVVEKDLEPTDDTVKAINKLSQSVRDEVTKRGLVHFPYVRFREAA